MMGPSDYIGQAISELLEYDEKIKARFYSHTFDETPIEALHQTHHRIKQWIERLSNIRDELVADANASVALKPNEQMIFRICRQDMDDIAYGVETKCGFRVLRGSYVSAYLAPNMYEIVKRLRRVNDDNIDASNHLLIDLDFDNAGQAARFVIGKQVNGIAEWRTEDGVSLKSFKNEQANEVKTISERPVNL